MDLRDLVPRYGDRHGFFGNIDVMVLIRGDLKEIEKEIRRKFAAGQLGDVPVHPPYGPAVRQL